MPAARFNPNFKPNSVSVLRRVLPHARVRADRAAPGAGGCRDTGSYRDIGGYRDPPPHPHQPGGAVGAGAGLALHPRPGRAEPPTAALFERAARLPIGRLASHGAGPRRLRGAEVEVGALRPFMNYVFVNKRPKK